MIAEWRQLCTLTKIFYIGGLNSFLGLAVMILTGMTALGPYGNFSSGALGVCDQKMKAGLQCYQGEVRISKG